MSNFGVRGNLYMWLNLLKCYYMSLNLYFLELYSHSRWLCGVCFFFSYVTFSTQPPSSSLVFCYNLHKVFLHLPLSTHIHLVPSAGHVKSIWHTNESETKKTLHRERSLLRPRDVHVCPVNDANVCCPVGGNCSSSSSEPTFTFSLCSPRTNTHDRRIRELKEAKVVVERGTQVTRTLRYCTGVKSPAASTRRRRHLFVLGTLEEGRVVGGVHLQRGLRGDGRGAAAAAGPSVRVEELAGIIGAVAEARPVEALVGPVHLLRCVSLHEQVHRHDARRLRRTRRELRSFHHKRNYIISYITGDGGVNKSLTYNLVLL